MARISLSHHTKKSRSRTQNDLLPKHHYIMTHRTNLAAISRLRGARRRGEPALRRQNAGSARRKWIPARPRGRNDSHAQRRAVQALTWTWAEGTESAAQLWVRVPAPQGSRALEARVSGLVLSNACATRESHEVRPLGHAQREATGRYEARTRLRDARRRGEPALRRQNAGSARRKWIPARPRGRNGSHAQRRAFQALTWT